MAENKRRDFYIARVGDDKPKRTTRKQEDTPEKEEKRFISESFVSPYYGRNVKDENVFPYVRYGNEGQQYDSLREKRRITEESKRKFGHEYYEFSQIIQNSKKIEENLINEEQDEYRNITDEDEEVEFIPYKEKPRVISDFEEFDDNKITHYEEIKIEDEKNEQPQEVSTPKSRLTVKTKSEDDIYELDSMKAQTIKKYYYPPIELLERGKGNYISDLDSVNHQRRIINNTLRDFKIGAQVVNYTKGPAVTLFEVSVDPGVNVDKVRTIAGNLQMNLAVRSIRILAPIPGKPYVGIEVPNSKTELVYFGDLLAKSEFLDDGNPLNVVLGLDISGKPVYADISKMPHGLIAGATGSGKSVCINSMIVSMLYKAHPDELKMILIDPKVVEFSNYDDIPHLATPIITDPKLATASLRWAVEEMENRYQLFRHNRVRDITTYNQVASRDRRLKRLPYIVIIIDELADLMSVASNDVEEYIRRIAQKARASGIHLIVATQRPSTDIIKGTIKANIPTRIAFAVSSQVDSITILDKSGAEKLLGRGDMLYHDGIQERRVQGAYISFEEIVDITNFLREHHGANFIFTEEELQEKALANITQMGNGYDAFNDEYFPLVARFVVENDTASINRVQKSFSIGFNRAQAIMEALESLGIVSQGQGGKARDVLVDLDQLEDILADL